MAPAPRQVRFDVSKYGVERHVDAARCPQWTGIVPDGDAHVLDFIEVLIVHRGAATLLAAGRRSPVGPPSVVVTRPGVERRVAVTAPLVADLVVFPERAARRLGGPAALAGLATGAMAVTPSDAADLAAVSRLLRHELEAGRDDAPLMLDALLTQFVVRLRRAAPPGALPQPPRLLARFEHLLERDFRHEHRVSAYAARLGVTADHLSAVARAHGGGSAKAMIEGRLAREAVALLATRRSVAGIAADLGYDEPSHFSRAFRRWSGVAPQRLRSAR